MQNKKNKASGVKSLCHNKHKKHDMCIIGSLKAALIFIIIISIVSTPTTTPKSTPTNQFKPLPTFSNSSSPITADIFNKDNFKNNKGPSLLQDNTSVVQLAGDQFTKKSALFITGVMDLIYAIYPIISKEAQEEFN